MWPPVVIMRGPLVNNPSEMTFAEGNQEVKTFATKAPAQSLAHCVGLGGSHGRPQDSHPQVRETLVDFLSEDAIPIVDDEAVGMVARQLSFAKNASAGIALWSKDSISLKTRDIARLVSKAPRRRYEVISL